MYDATEVAKFTTKQLQASVRPSVLKDAKTAELRHGLATVTVTLERVHDRGAVRERLRFKCPGCGALVRTIGFGYDRWGCRGRKCLGWNTRARRRIGCAAPHVGQVVADANG